MVIANFTASYPVFSFLRLRLAGAFGTGGACFIDGFSSYRREGE
jgi:hypothetical protein